jgi:hypothetical protein
MSNALTGFSVFAYMARTLSEMGADEAAKNVFDNMMFQLMESSEMERSIEAYEYFNSQESEFDGALV